MKTVIVRMMALALMAFSLLAVSCHRQLDDDLTGMAEVIGQGDLIVITDEGDGIFTVLYCKAGDKTFGVLGENPMAVGERFPFADEDYTYAGDFGVTFPDKSDLVVMPIYAKKGSMHYYMYLNLLSSVKE